MKSVEVRMKNMGAVVAMNNKWKNSMKLIVLLAVFMLLPVFSRMGLLPGHEKKDLQKLTFGSSAFTVFGLDCLVAAAASLYYSTTIQNGVLVFRVLAATLAVLGVGLLIAGALRHRNRA